MAAQFCTSCNLETALSSTAPGPFASVGGAFTINVGSGPAGNNTITGAPAATLVLPNTISSAGFAFGVGLAMSSAPGGTASNILMVTAGANTLTLTVNSAGTLTFTTGSSMTATSSSGTFLFNGTRQYVEVYLSGSGASATAKIQYEGTVVATVTGTAYTFSSLTAFTLGQSVPANPSPTYDSIYLVDTTGSARNNLLGKRVVTYVVSAGVGQFSQYTPNGAANDWQCVSSIPNAGDTIYASDSTAGDQLAVTLTSAFGLASTDFVMQRASARQEVVGGVRTIALGVGNGTTVTYGSGQALTTTYASINQIWDTDPTTGSAWVLANLASRQASVKTAT